MDTTSVTKRRKQQYIATLERIRALLSGDIDWVAAMATVACELHHEFDHYHWTGFYRNVNDQQLIVGPYQGGHGCLSIEFGRGVCGHVATTKETQLVHDVNDFEGHIACSSSTQSEIVVPVLNSAGRLIAVLDVDSNYPAAFSTEDKVGLESLCADLGRRFG